jgi:hypothetical protein
MMVSQETLDFLAVIAGLKPVYLLGRGFDDPQWVRRVINIANKLDLHIIKGTEWNARPDADEYPLRASTRKSQAVFRSNWLEFRTQLRKRQAEPHHHGGLAEFRDDPTGGQSFVCLE